jgi:hypothetical protein
MHRELRAWNPDLAASPERLDPILKIILQLYSNQLARIDQRIDQLWDVAKASLIRSLFPECKRWPVPAYTVMKCKPADPVVEVDPTTAFFYRERREGGQTFFFSARRKEKLISAEVKHVFLKADQSVADLSPQPEGVATRPTPRQLPFSAQTPGQLFIAIEYSDTPANFNGSTIFLNGVPDVLKQIRWGRWYPSSVKGGVYEDSGFCPGLTNDVAAIIGTEDRSDTDWGGLRSGTTLFRQIEDNFVVLPEAFVNTWELGPPDAGLLDAISAEGLPFSTESGHFYWIRVDLSPRGNKALLTSPLDIYFNAFVATNKSELTLFKHTGGNRLIEIELPEDIANTLDILSVVDSDGRRYYPRYEARGGEASGTYSLEERESRLVLWFDFSSQLESPPDSITVTYTVTAGTDANGIEAGKIDSLYENHPGVVEAINVIPVTGAIPAKSEEQIVNEVAARLRGRDRALSFTEIARWATTFDSRIKTAACRNGIERTPGGVRRCVVVSVGVNRADFYSDDETDLLRRRLGEFLKSRAPVNTQFSVEIQQS